MRFCFDFFHTHLCPARGHWVGGFGWLSGPCHGFTSWGNALCHFLPPAPQPLTPSTASPSFHSRLHNHCTAHKGLSSQVQPRLARIKERFQHKMFFSHFFKTASSLFFLVFLFLLMSSIFSSSHTCCTFFTHFFHFMPHKTSSLSN